MPLVGLAAPVRHALKALAHLAAAPDASAETSRVARKLKLPGAALSKSFQRLAKAGLLESRRGPGGGYRLAVDPAKITLAEVVRALDLKDERRGRCLLEDKPCGAETACAIHHAALGADAILRAELARLTIADLAAGGRP
ncbi:MAG: Rrf2 family transcriptional regulator [Elusimicrobia bacterium]|nr:Rrf2 family transcriptional regulator [Elusimicrobiota bacterium]